MSLVAVVVANILVPKTERVPVFVVDPKVMSLADNLVAEVVASVAKLCAIKVPVFVVEERVISETVVVASDDIPVIDTLPRIPAFPDTEKVDILVVPNVDVPCTASVPVREREGTESEFTDSEVMEVVARVEVPATENSPPILPLPDMDEVTAERRDVVVVARVEVPATFCEPVSTTLLPVALVKIKLVRVAVTAFKTVAKILLAVEIGRASCRERVCLAV